MFHESSVGENALTVGFNALTEVGKAGVDRWGKNPTFRWVSPTQRQRALRKTLSVELNQRPSRETFWCCQGQA